MPSSTAAGLSGSSDGWNFSVAQLVQVMRTIAWALWHISVSSGSPGDLNLKLTHFPRLGPGNYKSKRPAEASLAPSHRSNWGDMTAEYQAFNA